MAKRSNRTPADKAARKFIWLAIAIIIGWLGISGAGGPLFGKLSSVQQNDNSGFLPSSAESTKAQKISTKFSAQDTTVLPAMIIFTGDGGPTGIANVTMFAEEIKSVVVPNSSKSIGDYLAPDAQLMPIPAQDGLAVLLSIPLDDAKATETLSNNEPALVAIVDVLREEAKAVSGFSETHVTGIGGIFADLFESFGSIDTTLLGITFLVVAIILIVVYRSPVLWFIPLFSSLIALTTAGAMVYLLAKEEIIDLDGQSQGILSVLVIGAATDYALLLIARYREELHHFDSRVKAMRVALRGVFEPIVASGATVVVGLAVLALSDLKNVRSLGPVAAIGIIAAQLVMLTLLPAILVALGRWIFWPKIPRHDDVDEKLSGLWSKVATRVGEKPRQTWIGTASALLVALAFAPSLNTGGLSLTDGFTDKTDSVIGLEALGKHFPAGAGDPTLIVVKESDAQKVAAAVSQVNGVDAVAETIDKAAFMSGGVPSSLVVDGFKQLEVILDKPADSLEAQAYIPDIRSAAHQASNSALVGGTTAANYDIQRTNINDRNKIIPIALVVIGVILALLLRSIVAPIVLILTTVLSFGATLGLCHLAFTHLFDFKATDGSFPLFAFVFLVALGIDYNIFLMTRVREESLKIGTREGVLKGVTVTGGVITSAGIVLAATFAVLGTLPLVFIAELGFAVALGVLLDTIIVRSLLVPALTHDMGKVIWWPSKLSKSEPGA